MMGIMIKGLLEGKRWAALLKALPEYYVPGFIMTLKISIVGLLVALVLGIVFGTFSTMKFKPAKILARIYVEFLQNTPLALQILFYYSVLPLLFSNSGFRIPKFVLGVIGVGVYHGAYIAEVIRTGIEAVPKGQFRGRSFPGFFVSGDHVLYHSSPDDPHHHAASGKSGTESGEEHLYPGHGSRNGPDVLHRFLGC